MGGCWGGKRGNIAKFGRILDRCRVGVLQMLRRWGSCWVGERGNIATLHLVAAVCHLDLCFLLIHLVLSMFPVMTRISGCVFGDLLAPPEHEWVRSAVVTAILSHLLVPEPRIHLLSG